ncbi:MAG: hypothetical protein DWI57_10120 [Chloroflexi bacterium]|nr:MAG: hypothetical protein DWI57_10120 [Chloroflexota bacterium]
MSPKTVPPRRYNFFILGLWLQPDRRPGEPVDWRIVLEDPHTAERTSFGTLAELDAFLSDWMEERVSNE